MKITLKKKLLSVFLSFAMFSSLSSTYFANSSDKTENNISKEIEIFTLSGDNLPESTKELMKDDSDVALFSVRDDDDLYSITYENEDGSKSSKLFDIPIKYIDKDGEVEYIDTSIIKKIKPIDIYEYQNAANDFLTEFSTDAQTGIRITKDQKSISMSVLNESKSDINPTFDESKSDVNSTFDESKSDINPTFDESKSDINPTFDESKSDVNLKKFKNKNIKSDSKPVDLQTKQSDEVKNGIITGDISDEFVYPEAFGDKTSVKYTNTLRGIKADIILDENPGINTFSFNLDTEGLIPVLVEDGRAIVLVEPNEDNNYENIDQDNIKFYIPSIYVYDSYVLPEGMESDTSENPYQHFTENCYYEIEKLAEGQYNLTLVVSEEFLKDPRTVYPVTVDPTLAVVNTSSNIADTYTTSATPSTNYQLSHHLRVGNNSIASDGNGAGLYYAFLRYYSLPSLPSGNVIDSAYLKLNFTPGQTTAKNAKISHIDSSWDASQLTWNSNNPIVGSIVDQNVSHNGCSYYNFNVTQSINSWYNGVNGNCGWRIAYSNESEKDLTRLYSSDCGVSSDIPNLTINYKSSAPTPTVPARTIADGIYYIRNGNSRKYMDVYNNGTTDKTPIIQYNYNGAKNQQWKVKYESDGYYSLRPMHISGQTKTIDMQGKSSSNINGTDAKIYPYNSIYDEQKFLIESQYGLGGGYQIGTKQSGGNKVLEVTNSSTNDGEVIQIWDRSIDRTNDNWYFEKVNFGCAWGFNYKYDGNQNNSNCLAYALGKNYNGRYKWPPVDMYYRDSVDTVATRVENYVKNTLGRSIRRINGPTSPISSNEYRFCMRVGNRPEFEYLAGVKCDYHYWVQTADGQWCDKSGNLIPNNPRYTNPSTANWPMPTVSDNYYNSITIYFASTWN